MDRWKKKPENQGLSYREGGFTDIPWYTIAFPHHSKGQVDTAIAEVNKAKRKEVEATGDL